MASQRVDLRYRVLGAVEVFAGTEALPLTGRPLSLLACLLLRANRVVSMREIERAVWGENGPRQAKPAIQTYVLRLRRLLRDERAIRTEAGGYRIVCDEQALDLTRFRLHCREARRASSDGDLGATAAAYRAGLDEWQGDPLSNVDSDALLSEDAAALVEERVAAYEGWTDAVLALGRPLTVLPELTRLLAQHPLREQLHERAMWAMYRAGRRSDGLALYQQLRERLAEELGLDPSPPLRRLYERMLHATESSDPAPEVPAAAEPARATPRELPADTTRFTGRAADLAALSKLVPDQPATAPLVVAAVEGTAGAGKSTLAIRFAHQVADRFPGGQVFLNLRGYGPGDPVSPAAALDSLLHSVHRAGSDMPTDVDARAALWRSATSGQGVLVVLDNARDSEQVRALLPGPGCLAVVTSRAQLRGLTAGSGATRLPVGLLDEHDALDLLDAIVGADRVHREPEAARRFVAHCARLPLAISILGERAERRGDQSLDELLDEVRDQPNPLGAFDLEDGETTNLRAVFAHSHAALDTETARLFRMLGLHPGTRFGTLFAAALCGEDVATTRRTLDRLVRASLIEPIGAGDYRLHDLLREFAADLAHTHDGEETCALALGRGLDWYVSAARRADRAINPLHPVDEDEPAYLRLPNFDSREQGLQWHAKEHQTLLTYLDIAVVNGWHARVCGLAWALNPYLLAADRRDNWVSTMRVGLDAAREIGDRPAEARLCNAFGAANLRWGSLETAVEYCTLASELAAELHDDGLQYSCRHNLGFALSELDRFAESVRHLRVAIELAESLGRPKRVAASAANIIYPLISLGLLEEAVATAEHAMSMTDEQRILGLLLNSTAGALQEMGRYPESMTKCLESIRIFEDIDAPLMLAASLQRKCYLLVAMGDLAAARIPGERALAILTEFGHRGAVTWRAELSEMLNQSA